MAEKVVGIETNLRDLHDWHRLDDVMPLLDVVLRDMEKEVDAAMIELDPGVGEYDLAATAAWIERRAIHKLRKSLHRVAKRGKTASKRIAPQM